MKKIVLWVLGLVVVGVIGTTFYISSIDWNEHKDKLASQFYEMTGKKIVFGGPVSLKFMPYPSLTAQNVKILNPQDIQAKPLVEVKNLVAELSAKPLLSGVFEVRRMVLDSPQINVELSDEGKLSWQSGETAETPKAEIFLNSVSLKNAALVYEDLARDITLRVDNLSGEVVAQSLYGPYRLEGNYIKDGNPQGFAISVGKLSDSFATSLNLVLTHPVSKSYVRFDGSFMLKNKVLNGNVIFESAQLKDFWKANWPDMKFDEAYDFPLALTFDAAFNERQLNLSNIVVRYGETQGAGNMQIPLNDGVFGAGEDGVKPRVDLAFNFTDFNLDPVVYTLMNLKSYYRAEGVYNPSLPFDLLADIKSVRTQYNGQAVKNFETSFDVIENIITVNTISAVLPGDTDVSLKGSVSAYEDKPFYNMDVTFKSTDFLKTLNWAGIHPIVSVASTYKKAVGSAKLSGTLDKIQVSPFNVSIDKSSLSGEAGFKLTGRPDMMLVLNTDMINFDNYISALPVEEKNKTWTERMKYRFSKLGMLNDFDMQITAKLDAAIYENMPFEKIDFDAVLLNGKMDINKLNINSVANAVVELNGQVAGFGDIPNFDELNYNITTDNVSGFINKLELKVPDLDYKKLAHMNAKGVMTGDVNHFALNSQMQLESLETEFQGQVMQEAEILNLSGDLSLKHPDFVKMLEDLRSPYLPQGQALGLFGLRSKINGNKNQFRLDIEEANIGYSAFSGSVNYEKIDARPNLMAELNINKFEIERFLNKNNVASARPSIKPDKIDVVEFLANPNWNAAKINYDFYTHFDLSGSFSVQDLSYYNYKLRDVSLMVSLLNGVFDIQELQGKISQGSGDISAKATLKMLDRPNMSVQAEINNMDVAPMAWSGKVYGLNKGMLNSKFFVEGEAESFENFAKTIKGNGDFVFSDINVKGWDLRANWDDIKKRETVDGLAATIKDNLMKGTSAFNTFSGNFVIENGTYTLSNTVMKGNGAEVKIYGNGTFEPWEMNVTCDVKYDDAKYLPGYSFSLKGPTNAPLLDVNVSSLFNLYKSRQDKIDNDARIAREAENNRIKLLIEEQKNIASSMVSEIRKEIDDNITKKSKEVYDQNTTYKYDSLRQKAGKLAADLIEKVDVDSSVSLSEATVDELKKINQNGLVELEKLKREVSRAYLDDVKKNIADVYSQIVSEVNKSKQILFQYNTARDSFNSRLAEIVTDYQLDEDVNMQGWNTFVQDKAAGFEADNLKMLDEKNAILKSEDENEVAAYNRDGEELLAGLEADIVSMENTLADMRKYAEEKVAVAEEAYNAKLREAEVKRKVEENKGSISIKKSGRVVEVVRDIKDIEEAEELVEDKEVKVLDFSKPKKRINTTTQSSSENVVKKGRGKIN